ncbi:hypothetical protein ED208_01855 [Stagnimonas aquatica]|uniref:OmpR/PhoB-type domain-containing protein n=1 Tax=Stagnimonas aquatica TaxID=2689987 RepID=A0A3N0VKJ3_9GAMM|nr:AAA family ATPase [Stagnimonas aquatica]ROH93292.1 hypothetical protein ED208_01855 [Stagnimonas aquatica]
MSVTPAICFGPYRLIGQNGPLLRDDQEIRLQRKALGVLWTLACRMGEPVTRSDLMDAVWPGAIVVDDVLSFQIKALRQAIEDDPRNPQYILTAHRIGFRLVNPGAAATPPPASNFVGREAELEFLRETLARAAQGQRQLLFVSGEAGIGKTALVDDFLARLRNDSPTIQIWRGRCLEMTGETEAYQPVLDALEGGVSSPQGDQLLDQLRASAPSWLRQLPRFLAPDELEHLRRITSGTPPERQRRELAEALEAYTASRTLVLVVEDLHWSDASTVTVLDLLAQREAAARLLVICTCRSVETILGQHPARALQLGLTARGRAQTLFLAPLPPDEGGRLIERRLAGVSAGQREALLLRSGGHPLFLVHLTDYLRDLDAGAGGGAGLDGILPPQLRELIELQLSQLTPSEQLLLEVAAVTGREFAAAAVSVVSGVAVEAVEEALESLARRGLFIVENGLAIWPDGTASGRFQFRHALYGQTLRLRLGASREARLHRRLAERLEQAYSGRDAEIANELAHHYEAGGVAAKAAEWCVQTAQNALDRLAPHEVREQVARGLGLLESLAPDAERHRIELRLRVIASLRLQMEQGYVPSAGDDHRDRIDSLIELVGDDPASIAAIGAQWASRHFNMEFERAINFSERMRDIGRATRSANMECIGLGWAAHSLHCLGQHEKADHYAAEGLRLASVDEGAGHSVSADALMSLLGARAITRWILGYPLQALEAGERAVTVAEQLRNPYRYVMVICISRGMLLEFVGDYPRLLTTATEILELSRRCGHLESQRWARVLLGVAQYRTGDPEAALRTLQPVLDEMRQRGLVLQVPLGLVNTARAWSDLGEHERALATANEALQLIRRHGHRPWEPEVLRALGELQLKARPRAIAAVIAPIQEALALARARKALSMELRAATSLARLLGRQGKAGEALALLTPVLERFTEGGDLPDQCEARALIATLQR